MAKTQDIHPNDFSSIMNYVPDSIIITNNKGKIILVNSQTEQIFGYTQEELLGESIGILVPERFSKTHSRQTRDYYKNPKVRQMGAGLNLIGKRKNGSEVPLDIALSPWRNGDEVFVICAIRDITERKRTEKELKWKNKNLEILNTVTEAVHRSHDLEEIYNIALDKVTELDTVDMAAIYLVDRDRTAAILQAHRNVPEDYIRRAGRVPPPKGVTWKVINTGETINIENIQEDPGVGQAGKGLGQHGVLGIPITSEDGVIGVLWFFSYKERKFEQEEVALLTSVGNQIATAIAKAKMYRDLARKSLYDEIIKTVTQDVHRSIDLQNVLENAAVSMIENIDAAGNVAIYMVEGEEAVLKAHRGLTDSFVERAGRIPYLKGFTWKTIMEGKPRYCADTDKDEYMGPAGKKEGIKSYLSMPITYDGKTVGCININSKQKNVLDEEDLKLLEIVAHQISIAIRNAQQADELQFTQFSVDRSGDAIFWISPDARFLYVNDAACDLDGYSREEFLSMSVYDVDPNFTEEVWSETWEKFKQGGTLTFETQSRRKDGRILPIEVTANYLYFKGKEYVCAFVRDITQRKKMEEELKSTVEKLEIMLESLPVAVYTCKTEGDYGATYVSENITKLSGYAPHDFISENSFWADRIHPDQKTQILSNLSGLFEKGYHEHEYLWRTADGSYKWFYDFLKLIKQPNRTDDLIVGMWQDVTEKKQLIDELTTRAYQNEIVAKLGQISLTTHDLWEFMHIAVNAVSKALGAEYCKILKLLPDGENFLLVAGVGWKDVYIGDTVVPGGRDSQDGYTLFSDQPVIVEYLPKESRFSGPQLLHDHNVASGISTVIRCKGQIFGVIGAHTVRQTLFTQDDINFLEAVANLIAQRVDQEHAENELKDNLARLYKKNKYESIISTVTRCVHSSIGLEEVLENAVMSLNDNIDDVDAVVIYMVQGEEAVMKAHVGFPDSYIDRAGEIPSPKGFTWKTLIDGKTVYCPDVDKDTYIGTAGREMGTKSYISIPIIHEGRSVGTINVHAKVKNAFDEEELQLLEVVSNQISIAIRNAQHAEAVRESEERYKALYDQSPIGVFLIDRDLKITHCNASLVRIIQSSHDAVIGLDLHTLKDQTFVPLIVDAFKGRVGTLESPYKATTGSANVWLSVKVVPLYDKENNVHSVMGVVEDITARKLDEAALRESESRHRTIVEQTYDMTIECDMLGTILYANPQHNDILGYDPEELEGTNCMQLVHEDDRGMAMANFQKGLHSKEAVQPTIYRCKHKNGEIRWLESTGKAFKTASGETNGVISSRDITERKKMEEELLKSQKLESLSILAGGIAHDFNNLLTIILGNVNIAKMKLDPQENSYNKLTQAENAIQRATGLTQQLLTFSKESAPHKKAMAIDELIKESTLFALRGSNVDCFFSIDDNLLAAEIDEGQINQVINNLIINAQHAMPEGGSIEVGAKNVIFEEGNIPSLPQGEYVEIYVRDIGVGIPKEQLHKIFDPFFTTKAHGSGLGLASSFSIVKQHNGHISVDSEVGVGTTFTIYLPAHKESSRMTEDKEEDVKKGEGRILIMDDDDQIREILGEMLDELGYRPVFAKNSIEAIKIYKDSIESKDKIDAVILDLTIPGDIGGKETLKTLLDIDPNIKAIVSSGYSEDGSVGDHETYGFKAYIPKPYTVLGLSNILYDVLMH